MGKKKNKIKKNRDIEEIVYKKNNKSIKTMENVIKKIKVNTKTARKQFKDEIKVDIDKKVENYCNRKDIQRAEKERQIQLLKVIGKKQQEEENSL